jgi:hypothetical protein
MDLAVKVGGVPLITALLVYALDASGVWFNGDAFALLFILGGLFLGLGFLVKQTRLGRSVKIVAVLLIIGVFMFFFFPVVNIGTLPNGQDSASICNANDTGCSDITQLHSVTEYLWCMGPQYNVALPPTVEFMVAFG